MKNNKNSFQLEPQPRQAASMWPAANYHSNQQPDIYMDVIGHDHWLSWL